MEYAQKVIGIHETLFPWVDDLAVGGNGNIPDRMFSSELLFSLQHLNRNSIFTSLFDAQNLKLQTSLLIPRWDVVREVFRQNQSDYRYKYFLSSSADFAGVNYAVFDRYQGQDSLYNQMIPMLRISEMYMIAAEVAEKKEEALEYLNILRNNRGLRALPEGYYSQVDSYLEEEWLRELYGEGQLFFYYKRKMKTEIRSAYDPYGTKKSVHINMCFLFRMVKHSTIKIDNYEKNYCYIISAHSFWACEEKIDVYEGNVVFILIRKGRYWTQL